MFKRWLSAGLILLAVCLGSGSTAHAGDLEHALQTAPQGILIRKTNPFITTDTTGKSSATVVDGKNPKTQGTQVAQLTGKPRQFGALWSTDAGYLDLQQDQTLAMWLYLGDQETQVGDGMAFVLQNDPAGLAAMPKVSEHEQLPGETLGVWAVDNDEYQSESAQLAKTAIQNSWALEFDTHYNGNSTNQPGSADSFDVSYPAMHIAASYPGLASSYRQHPVKDGSWLFLDFWKYSYSLNHTGVIADVNNPEFMVDGQWHHLTLQWHAAAKTMTYTFDDRDPQTNQARTGMSRSVAVDPQLLKGQAAGAQQSQRVRWGLTSASGTHFAHGLVVLENIPGLVDADSQAVLTDMQHHQVLQKGSQVLSETPLQLDYHLKYRRGRQPWSDIRANLQVPTNFETTRVEISYGDDFQTVQEVPTTLIKEGHLSVRLPRDMDSQRDTATVRLLGRAARVSQMTKVAATNSTFTSTARVSSADTPEFIINPATDLDLQVTSRNPLRLPHEQDTVVTGKVLATPNTATLPAITVMPSLNDHSLDEVAVAADGTFKLPLKAQQLQPGTNRLELVAKTPQGDATDPVTVTVTVAGTLAFAAVSSDGHFQETQLTGGQQTIGRADAWKLAVRDTRGTDEKWKLMASATPFTAEDGQVMDGNLIYVTKLQTIVIGDEATTVFAHQTDDAVDDGLVDVAHTWMPRTGVLLQVASSARVGHYQSKLTWTLADAPD